MKRRIRDLGNRTTAVLVATLVLASMLAIDPTGAAETTPSAVTPGATVEILITPTGFEPASATVEPGTAVLWRNTSLVPNTVTSDDGLVDSGPIPPGGGFTATFPGAGWVSLVDVYGNAGSITVGSMTLEGAPDALAVSVIPDTRFPAFTADELGTHPEAALIISRRRLIVGVSPTATVAEINVALAAAGTPLIGGIADDNFLLVSNPGDDFPSLEAAAAILEASPAIRYAVPDGPPEPTVVPEDPQPDFDVGLPAAPDGWYWNQSTATATVEFPGQGANWGLENVRAPQAWNLREAIEDAGVDVIAGVVDADIGDGHPELPLLEQAIHCTSLLLRLDCVDDSSGSHGTHVSGVVSSSWVNPANFDLGGRPSLNNDTRVIGLPWGTTDTIDGLGGSHSLLDLQSKMVSLAAAGEPIKVINQSAGYALNSSRWAENHRTKTCGPLPAGDDANGSLPCVPSNDDVHMRRLARWAEPMRDVALRGALLDILFVTAAGNNARRWCWTGTELFRDPPNLETTDSSGDARTPDPAPLPSGCSRSMVPPTGAISGSKLNYVAANWTGSSPNPILVTESIGTAFGSFAGNLESFDRTSFSQIGGNVSAPGSSIYSSCRFGDLSQGTNPDSDPFHCTMSGTSMASPLVSSLALMLSRHSSEPSSADVRAAIVNWAVPNSAGGASPHIDAFASLLSLPGAARQLVDINDYSHDGNRRVFRDGSDDEKFDPLDIFDRTAPDNVIDMRDFRRFRDAWLHLCLTVADTGCPTTVTLDGENGNRKFDLNFDGCITRPGVTCRSAESVYPRFDFNGDGKLTSNDSMPMPFGLDGVVIGSRPASLAAHPQLTDLQVLQSQFDSPAELGDWTAGELDALMQSGDLSIDAQSLFDFGATSVDITATHLQTVDGSGLPRTLNYTLTPGLTSSERVVTVLANEPVRLVVTAEFPSPFGSQDVIDQTFELVPGEDRYVTACGIDVEITPVVIAPGSSTDLTATIKGCGSNTTVENIDIGLEISPIVVDGASIDSDDQIIVTDAKGTASAPIRAGTNRARYRVTAQADLQNAAGDAISIEGQASFLVDAEYEIEIIDRAGIGGPIALGTGPGISSDGTVAYVRVDSAGAEIWFDEGLGKLAVPGTRLVDERRWFGQVTVTDDGSVWALNEKVEPADIGTGAFQRRREIIRQPLPTGSQDTIAKSHLNLLGVIDADAGYELVGLPAPNDSSGSVFPIRSLTSTTTDAGPLYRLAVSGQPAGQTGPQIAVVPLDAGAANQPVHADNGATAINALFSAGDPVAAAEVIAVGSGVLGFGNTVDAFVLAVNPLNEDVLAVDDAGVPLYPAAPAYFSTTPLFTELGEQVAMSQDGRIIAFLGDRGDGIGLFLYLRPDPNTAAFEGPILVLGESFSNPIPDLGTDAQGNPIIFATWDTTTRIGLQHNEAGAAGLAGDHVVVSFIATPSAVTDDFTNYTGLFTADIELAVTADGTVANSARPVAAVQIDDLVTADARVTEIGVWDPIDDGASSDSGDHRLTWWQLLDNGEQHIIRATRITTPAGGAIANISYSAPQQSFTSLVQFGGPVAQAATDVMALAIPAMVIGDLTPTVGDLVKVTNRSHDTDGTAIGAVLTTSEGGLAKNLAPLIGVAGIYPTSEGVLSLSITAGTGAEASTTTVEVPVDPLPNTAPVAILDGPWVVEDGGQVVLDGSASSDPDDGDSVVAYDWDFDGNFDFGEFSGATVDLTVAEFDTIACTTTCQRDEGLPIRLRVTDSNGLFTITGAFLTLSSDRADFTLVVDPTSQFMNPGARTDLLVKVNSLGGFTDPVALTVGDLPAGWTASIWPTTVTPSGTALLSIFPDVAAPEGDVAISVTGTSGAITRTTGSTASVTFALIPKCFASISGRVVDAETGAPVSADDFVDVRARDDFGFWTATAVLASDGTYSITDVPISARLFIRARGLSGTTYLGSPEVLHQSVCDADLEVNFEVEPIEYGTVIGRIVEGIADPTNTTRTRDLFPTDIPVEGAVATAAGVYKSTTGPDGTFRIENIPLVGQNEPRFISVFGGQDGFWGTSANITIREGAVIDVGDLPILERCWSTVSASGTVHDTNGDPASTFVRLGPVGVTSSAVDGTFSLGPIEKLLGTNNAHVEVDLKAGALFFGGSGDNRKVAVNGCDLTLDDQYELIVEAVPPPPPPDNFATVQGQVIDERTGVGVPNPRVILRWFGGSFASIRADADGFYLFDNIFVGVGDDTTRGNLTLIVAATNDYWNSDITAEFIADSTSPTTIDIPMLPIDKSTVSGIVVDVASQQPIEGAAVRVGGSGVNTGPDGRFEITGLIPGEGNVPIIASGFGTKNIESFGTFGRWYTQNIDVVLQPGATTEVNLELLQICTDVTISGLVLNAETLLPLEDVSVSVPGVFTKTGADGTFLLEGIRLSNLNEPAQVTVAAAKFGFITLRRTVTVFCGANVRVEFGTPNGGTGSITGTVADADSGLPIANAFVGSEFGGTDTTDALGNYLFDFVPVNSDGSPRDWEIDVVGPRGAEAAATVTVVVDTESVQDFELTVPANQVPVANSQTVAIAPDAAVGITLTGSDPDGDPITFAIASNPTNGTLSGAGSARIYTPDAGTTSDSFTFTVTDGDLTSIPATVTISVPHENSPPLATPQAIDVDEDTPTPVVLAGADADGDQLSYQIVDPPSKGTLTGTAPDLTYSPDPDTTGSDSFTFSVGDGTEESAPATVSITIIAIPDPPDAVDDTDTTDEDTSVTTDVAFNDDDIDGDLDPSSVTITSPPSNGAAVPNGDGTVTYTPDLGFAGDDQYTYEICDSTSLCDTALVDITVDAVIIEPPPDLVIVMADAPDPVDPGQTLIYTLDYRNDGGHTTGVTITETVPPNTSFNSAASSPGWACAPDGSTGSLCSITIGDLAGSESGSVDFAVTVASMVASGVDEILDTASIADDGTHGPDQTPADNETSETTAVTAAPDLSVIKVDDGDSGPGLMITYTLTYANSGNQEATGIVLHETVPVSTTFDADSSDSGWTCLPDATAGSICELELGSLSVGSFGHVHFAVTVDQTLSEGATQVDNTAEISDDEINGPDQDTANNRDTVNTSVNRPPIADAGGPYSVDEGNSVALDGSNSIDPEGDDLIFEWDFDNDGVFDDATGPNPAFSAPDGPASLAVSLRVTDLIGLSATDQAVVNVANTAPVVSLSSAAQLVQYSDAINNVAVTVTDVAADTPDVVSTQFAVDGGAFTPGLPAGLTITPTPGSCTTLLTTRCSSTLSGAADVAPGQYTIRISIADEDGAAGTADFVMVVLTEDAIVEFDEINPMTVDVVSPGGDAGLFSLSFVVSEADQPDDVTGDRNLAGDITKASVAVSLEPIGPGSPVLPVGPCTRTTEAGLNDPDSTHNYDTLIVTCDFVDAPVNTYVVSVAVGDRYTGSGQDVLTISDPSLGFITGGGWFYWPGTDDRTNFGYTVRHNKKGTSVRGNLLMIRRLPDGTHYRLKSNRIDGLAIGETLEFGWATFAGKATYIEPGWTEPEGNHSWIVYVEDHGEPGISDRIWIQVSDKNGDLATMSVPSPSGTNAQTLEGGNLVVPHTNTRSDRVR